MDNRVVLTVLFVTLSWAFMGTYAQSTTTTMVTSMTTASEMSTTTASEMNTTTAPANSMITGSTMTTTAATTNGMATGSTMTTTAATTNGMATGSTMTATAATTNGMATGSTMTTTAATTNGMATGSTMTTTAATTNGMTTGSTMNTTANSMATGSSMNTTAATANGMTTGSGMNLTAASGSNMTTGAATTPAPTTPQPLMTNTAVEALNASISREACGSERLCADQPAGCDPSTGSCFFLAARRESGQNFAFDLAGESDGYVACSLSATSQMSDIITYVCANNGGVVRFFTTFLNNGQLTETTLPVNSVRGRVIGRRIQCTFLATVPPPVTRADTFAISVSTGSFDPASGDLGAPFNQLRTDPVNLAMPNSNVTNTIVSVAALTTDISNEGCGTDKLCAAEPAGCNPAASGSCIFFSANQRSGQTFDFELAGESSGYLAAILSTDDIHGNNDTAFVCINNNNNSVEFVEALLNDTKLIPSTEMNVSSVNASVSANKIQCIFTATIPDTNAATTRAAAYSLRVSTGTFDPATRDLGVPMDQIRTDVLDLTNPNTTVINLIMPANSTAVAFHQPLAQTLLFTVGVLGLTML